MNFFRYQDTTLCYFEEWMSKGVEDVSDSDVEELLERIREEGDESMCLFILYIFCFDLFIDILIFMLNCLDIRNVLENGEMEAEFICEF